MKPEEITDFVYDEAWMLDQGQFHDWLDLWLPEAIYWMPLNWNQQDPINETSLLYEDNFMLRLRVERLHGARTFSQKPKSRCHHVLNRPRIEEVSDDEARVVTQMHYVETRLDEQMLLALTVRHHLKRVDGKIMIAGKRVDILNCDAAFGNIQLLP
ncbi:aromatic-ring-hydroxylating dioxygenase subunit beta [Paracoccus saliphilus]|uniref:3-phenylpropionate/cinnamic acid dioxygenase, small subunit n=1 Tax=Paracoccus saliphilus TaxID=405559 RepID=A0AA46A6C9_9RHOB|nr:aromatic-ring-hydroxylating dioxygenase subunit beta [Paracoccus saliphilus]WCR05597.1 aromatic-ring-hydroxylating dioxygenase subunit beta [Paracoccus saliphilus]SIS96092.1 3-phenylpropionate/cinnamic acid dioxygenase, small subunit [Paracoccus saliphilus]